VNEPGALFEEPPAMMPAVTDPVAPVDTAVAQQKNGNSSCIFVANWIDAVDQWKLRYTCIQALNKIPAYDVLSVVLSIAWYL